MKFLSRKTLDNSLNRIHELALCLVHNHYNSSLYDTLQMANEKTRHQKNLDISLKKFVSALSPPKINDLLSRNFQSLYFKNKETAKFGTETIR